MSRYTLHAEEIEMNLIEWSDRFFNYQGIQYAGTNEELVHLAAEDFISENEDCPLSISQLKTDYFKRVL